MAQDFYNVREKKITVLKGAQKKPSSQRWLLRHLNDPYVRKAEQEGARSRSFYKIQEIDKKYHLFRPDMRILDLGCAPGGWSQYVSSRILKERKENPGHCGSEKNLHLENALRNLENKEEKTIDSMGILKNVHGEHHTAAETNPVLKHNLSATLPPGVVGVDLLPMDPLAGVHFIQGDAEELERCDILAERSFHFILSDMAPSFTGHRITDCLKMENLIESVWHLTQVFLRPGGGLLFKAFHGPFIASLKPFFATVRYIKPAASRTNSREIYILATGFSPRYSENFDI